MFEWVAAGDPKEPEIPGCGGCHPGGGGLEYDRDGKRYDAITKGYHFQQGWDRIKDDFSKQKPWVLSDGMMGKF